MIKNQRPFMFTTNETITIVRDEDNEIPVWRPPDEIVGGSLFHALLRKILYFRLL